MDRAEASEKIKAHCKTIALEMMDLNPTITHLDDQETQEALFEASYELKSSKHAFSMMALGNGGDWARLHAPVLGQSLVYATLRSEFKLSNKGLVNIRDLKNAWALMEY